MPYETLCVVWFILLGALLAGYAMLDGFDLGVGIMHPFLFAGDSEREAVLETIGPVWDGNEVWLVTFGGALFAMFPLAYASMFSGAYSAVMLVILTLLLRAVSLVFRGRMNSSAARRFWDWLFCASSFATAFLFGLMVGNAVQGVSIGEDGTIHGGLRAQLRPYPAAVGMLAVSLFALHGSSYLLLHIDGKRRQRIRAAFIVTYPVFALLFVGVTAATLMHVPNAIHTFNHHPLLWAVPIVNLIAILGIPISQYCHRPLRGFLISCSTIAVFIALIGAALFPNLVRSSPDQNSITIYAAASSYTTLGIGLAMAAIGMPCVLAYTFIVYRTFRARGQAWGHATNSLHGRARGL